MSFALPPRILLGQSLPQPCAEGNGGFVPSGAVQSHNSFGRSLQVPLWWLWLHLTFSWRSTQVCQGLAGSSAIGDSWIRRAGLSLSHFRSSGTNGPRECCFFPADGTWRLGQLGSLHPCSPTSSKRKGWGGLSKNHLPPVPLLAQVTAVLCKVPAAGRVCCGLAQGPQPPDEMFPVHSGSSAAS